MHGYRKKEVLAKLKRGRDSSYFGLFSTLRVVWLCFCPKGLFGRISKMEMLPYFDPTYWMNFSTDF